MRLNIISDQTVYDAEEVGLSENHTNDACAEISQSLNEPMIGTASQVDLWVFLEVREPWEARNLESNSLPEIASTWIRDTTSAAMERNLRPRTMFIKHRRRPTDPLQLFLLRDGVTRHVSLGTYDELGDVDAFDESLPTFEQSLYMVCTHGKRDLCCSRLGLQTWRKLDELSGGRAWQTTHLGGHRYAPNVVTLPSGRSYGRVRHDVVESFFQAIENDDIAEPFLRGNSSLPPDAQVHEAEMIRRGGIYVDTTEDQVRFRTDAGLASLPIPEKTTMKVLASCKDSEWKTVPVYAIV